MSMIHVLWHDSMTICSTQSVSHKFEDNPPAISCRFSDSSLPLREVLQWSSTNFMLVTTFRE